MYAFVAPFCVTTPCDKTRPFKARCILKSIRTRTPLLWHDSLQTPLRTDHKHSMFMFMFMFMLRVCMCVYHGTGLIVLSVIIPGIVFLFFRPSQGISGRIVFGERLPASWFCGASLVVSGVVLLTGGTGTTDGHETSPTTPTKERAEKEDASSPPSQRTRSQTTKKSRPKRD